MRYCFTPRVSGHQESVRNPMMAITMSFATDFNTRNIFRILIILTVLLNEITRVQTTSLLELHKLDHASQNGGAVAKISQNGGRLASQVPEAPMHTPVQRANITFFPAEQMRLPLNQDHRNITLHVDCTSVGTDPLSVYVFLANTDADRIIVGENATSYSLEYNVTAWENGSLTVTIPVRGIYLGKATLEVWIGEVGDGGRGELAQSYPIIVFAGLTQTDLASVVGIFIGMALSMMGFGFTIRWNELRNIFNKPLVMLVGFSCQYILMPLTAYGLGAAFNLPANMKLALLAAGCCPGGSPSNISTMALGGDLNLSVIMTFMSTIALIVVTPFWMMSVGNTILQEGYPDASITIPWRMFGIFIGLFAAPCAIGILFGCFVPRIARILSFIVRPIAVLLVLACIVMILYNFSWFFAYANKWQLILAPISLVIIGNVVGLLVGLVATRDTSLALTVMVEAGIQNIAPATVILRAELPEEDAFVALLMPLFVIMTGIAVVVILAPIFLAFKRIHSRKTGSGNLDHSSAGDDNDDDSRSSTTGTDIELQEKRLSKTIKA